MCELFSKVVWLRNEHLPLYKIEYNNTFCVDNVLCWQCFVLTMFCAENVLCWQCFLMTMFCVDNVLCWQCFVMIMFCIANVSKCKILQTLILHLNKYFACLIEQETSISHDSTFWTWNSKKKNFVKLRTKFANFLQPPKKIRKKCLAMIHKGRSWSSYYVPRLHTHHKRLSVWECGYPIEIYWPYNTW